MEKKHAVYNPVWQNKGHVKALMELLKTDKEKIFHPIVAFSGKGEPKKVTATTPVMYIRQVSKYMKELNSPMVLSEDQVNKIVAILKQAHIKDPQAA